MSSSDSDQEEKPRARGLPSIQAAREARSEGKNRMPSPKFWAYVGLVFVVGGILYWRTASAEIEHARTRLLADQRTVAAELGPRWNPLRDKIEQFTMALAKEAGPEIIDRDALGKWDFRARAGIYLRMRVEEAQTVEELRKGAMSSLRDGFTACLKLAPNPNPTTGKECKRTRDCPAREFCNEQNHCSRPGQPFNLRVAYRTLHILDDEWVREVQGADSELRMRLFRTSYDDAVRDDIPLAIEVLTAPQYFMVVLDETPAGMQVPAGDAGTTIADAVQGVPHMARVGVFRLADGKPMLRIRRNAGGEEFELIGSTPEDPGVLAALQRQEKRCALALTVREALGDDAAAPAPPPK